jgi:hypothetical protein
VQKYKNICNFNPVIILFNSATNTLAFCLL